MKRTGNFVNLCLQKAGRKLVLLRDATVQEIAKLIIFSPKRSSRFNEETLVQSEAGHTGISVQLLCPTRWTARWTAIDAVLKDYTVGTY